MTQVLSEEHDSAFWRIPGEEPTEADLVALTRSQVIERIFDNLSDPNAASNAASLGRAIELGRSTLGILVRDRRKRSNAHEVIAARFSDLTPPIDLASPVSGDGERRNIRPRQALRLTKGFFAGIARLYPPIDAGLEIGHQEHLGDLTPADMASIAGLYTAAREAVGQSDYITEVHDATARLSPRVGLESYDTVGNVDVFRIHQKTPLFDATPDPDLLPHIQQVDLYARRTFAGLSKPGQPLDGQAVEKYLATQSPDEIVRPDSLGQLIPLSTSVILRVRSHSTESNS